MSQLQVLVATMHQKDFALFHKMNLQSDAVFANQCGASSFSEDTIDGYRVKMISTDTVGVGMNRNIALLAADADILLFADDDTVYYDGYRKEVLKAFEQTPDADLIAFGMRYAKNGEVCLEKSLPLKRRHFWNCLSYGACLLAVRRSFFLKQHVFFSHLFGGGCKFNCGEDSLYLLDCLRAGGKLYSHPYVLGETIRGASTWFTGYNEKFFYDKGVWIAAAFPKTKHLMKLYFFMRFRKRSEIPWKTQLHFMNSGVRNYSKCISFSETNDAH